MSNEIKMEQAEEQKKEQGKELGRRIAIKKEHNKKSDEAKALKNKLRKRESEINALKEENKSLKEEYLRQIADKENLRKRLEREKNEYYLYALSDFLKELLDVLDNFERALQNKDKASGESFSEGIGMIYKQYRDVLARQGVSPIEIEEKIFDPNLHQAFLSEESEDVDKPEVSEELQRGYTLHDRLLRPALVKVVVPKKEK